MALLRPGRLLAQRHFGALSADQAQVLAQSLGKSLPEAESYTLAEIYAEELDPARHKKRVMGFAC